MSVDFLTYNGLLSAIPDHGKGQFVIQKKLSFNNSDDHNLTSVNVTAKNAPKTFVLEMFEAPRVEEKLVGQNLPVKAIYELPFKVTMEDKLRYFNIR